MATGRIGKGSRGRGHRGYNAGGGGGAAGVLQPSDFAYLGSYELQNCYMFAVGSGGFTHRYVSGQLRFIAIDLLTGTFFEFTAAGASYGDTITSNTQTWTAGAMEFFQFPGLGYDHDTDKMWMTPSVDYTTTVYPSSIYTCSLGSGAITNLHHVTLEGVPSKRLGGGMIKLPSALATTLGCPRWVVGFGGYRSLMDSGGGASLGLTAYALPDPAGYSNDAEIPDTDHKILAEMNNGYTNTGINRGWRIWHPGTWPDGSPINYMDSGDPRNNPPYTEPPTIPPVGGAGWQSPNVSGHGWFSWGDYYLDTGMYIERNSKHAIAAIFSGGDGFQWYGDSDTRYYGGTRTGRTWELHLFDPSTFTGSGGGYVKRPDSMTDLKVIWPSIAHPSDPNGTYPYSIWGGQGVVNISGATYDATTGKMYVLGAGHGNTLGNSRLYVFQVS